MSNPKLEARLITEAPEMYRLLESALTRLGECRPPESEHRARMAHDQLSMAIANVITRIRGAK